MSLLPVLFLVASGDVGGNKNDQLELKIARIESITGGEQRQVMIL